MKVGVIGIGNMGCQHTRVYSELKDVYEVYVYDINSSTTKSLNEDVTVCDSVEALLSRVDAVSICTPTSHHFKIAREAIGEGVPCLIEKPITLTVKEGEDLLALIKGGRPIVGVGHIERFNPIVGEITKIVKRPAFVAMRRHNPASIRVRDSSVVNDLMVHDIDIIFNVLLEADHVIHAVGTNDMCMVLVEFANSFVSLSASRKSSKKVRDIYIEEEEFTVEGDFMNQEIFVYRKSGKHSFVAERYTQENIIEKVQVNKVEPLRKELETFIRCVENDEQFPVTPMQAVNNLRICEEIIKEMQK